MNFSPNENEKKRKNFRKLRRYEKIVFLWKNITLPKKTISNIKIEKNHNINSIKTNDIFSKKIKIVKIDIKTKIDIKIIDRTDFKIIFIMKINWKKQKTYANNYESFYDFESYKKYDENDSNIQYSYNIILEFFEICKNAKFQKKNFVSNNSFHVYIRICKKLFKMTMSSFVKISNFSIIKFSIFIIVDNEFEFRNYRYVIVWIIVALQTSVKIMIDNECVVFLIDEIYFQQILFAKKFIKMIFFINVRKIKNVFRENDFYLFLNLYLNEIFKKSSTNEYFRKKIHIVNDLKCKIFLNMNILKIKQMIFNMKNKIINFFTCKNLIVFIRIISKLNA